MQEILLETVICLFTAALLMILHEFVKASVYMALQRAAGSKRKFHNSIWKLHRYVDPVGLILSVTSCAPVSRPFMFRIREKKWNRILGIVGFLTIILTFSLSVLALRMHVFGVNGMQTLEGQGFLVKVITLFLQYTALLSLGMFVVNLFPVSTFDMGLLIAGFSARHYLGIIKKDAIIKMVLIFTLMIDWIHSGVIRIISLLL